MSRPAAVVLVILSSLTLHSGLGSPAIGMPTPVVPQRATAVAARSIPSAAAEFVPSTLPPQPATTPMPLPEGGTMIGGSDEQQDMVDRALQRYVTSGLELPPLRFELHAGTEPCGGNRGFFSPSSEPWTIGICTTDELPILHEIGHAWAEHTLSDADQNAYVEHQGLASWNDPETRWRDRGSEDAANTLAWGFLTMPIRGMPSDGPLAEKAEAFRLLTGLSAPRIER